MSTPQSPEPVNMLHYMEKSLLRCDYVKGQSQKEGDVMMEAEVGVLCFEDGGRVY